MISTPAGAAAASLAPDTEPAIDPVLPGAVSDTTLRVGRVV
jgi:hypothetical protein